MKLNEINHIRKLAGMTPLTESEAMQQGRMSSVKYIILGDDGSASVVVFGQGSEFAIGTDNGTLRLDSNDVKNRIVVNTDGGTSDFAVGNGNVSWDELVSQLSAWETKNYNDSQISKLSKRSIHTLSNNLGKTYYISDDGSNLDPNPIQ